MEENKNINPDTEKEQETSAPDTEEKADKKAEKKAAKAAKKAARPKKLKNQALLRRGGYSVAITAAVLAGLIVLNAVCFGI